jgi:hypothetical protein
MPSETRILSSEPYCNIINQINRITHKQILEKKSGKNVGMGMSIVFECSHLLMRGHVMCVAGERL